MKVIVTINYNKCTKCLECVKYCPTNVFYIKSNKIIPENKNCIYCKGCEIICPTNAIKVTALNEGLKIIKVQTLKLRS